ncbi:MAG: polyisoprenoid-binding protein [Thermoleophilia bacterium]
MSTTAITETIVPAGTWQLDPVHSTVTFEVSYLGGTFKGELEDVRASLVVEDGKGRLEGAATVESVDVKDASLATHLKSPEFFDAERYPELRFVASSIPLTSEDLAFTGEITIKGTTRPVEVRGRLSRPLTDPFGRERVGLALSAVIDRTDFGIDWNAPLPDGQPALANEVTIRADLYFIKGEAAS